MYLLEEAIRAHALGDAAITALIGDRWYAVDLPQGKAFPAITMQQVSGTPEHSHEGHSGIENARWQFTVWSDCYEKCTRLAWYVERRFDAFRGQWGNSEQGFMDIGRCAKTARVSFGKDPGQKLYRIAIDFYITYRSIHD